MPPPARPTKRNPERFDPSLLARSVIAIPLLDKISAELKTTARIEESHTDLRKNHNTAIIFRHEYADDPKAAMEALRDLLAETIEDLHPTHDQRVEDPDPQISSYVSLAWLDGPVIRQLLARDALRENPVIDRIWPQRFDVIIDINLDFKLTAAGAKEAELAPDEANQPDPRVTAKILIEKYVERAKREGGAADDPDQGVDKIKSDQSNQYVFARLQSSVIQKVVEIDQSMAQKIAAAEENSKPAEKPAKRSGKRAGAAKSTPPESAPYRTIYHIWPDFDIRSCITRSIATVKVDAAHQSFTAMGKDIVWAVMDSGIDATHPHFEYHQNVDPNSPYHADFSGAPEPGQPLVDLYGHGTHVAGIIAGEQSAALKSKEENMISFWRELDAQGQPVVRKTPMPAISGMAPKCKLVSLKVLDKFGQGNASNVMSAINHVQLKNSHGRDIKIHGVNLSLGHVFDPEWFACGHSPLCVEVNRLVKSGVVVVIAAGNTGYGTLQLLAGKSTNTGLDLTINDPGNAELAITVGSTHREMPHRYGVSYFSSKGPTGDGRCKPDLLAPGEKIISCAAPNSFLVGKEAGGNQDCRYFETSGTSMAAPHVSGAIAAFLSIRTEYQGEPELVKKIFTSTATDLGRDRYFQGSGLVDLMRAIQSV
ncbi:MAG TPA: S8 family peptidase [Chthoniobacterales bacterium]|nr:S8 family peptidase [Chthoniobacterales bacterium]